MQLSDARRLTGPNLLSRSPLVVIEIDLEPGESLDSCVDVYRTELGRIRQALGLLADAGELLVRPHQGGATIGYEAPIDIMLACAEMSEWAATSTAALSRGEAPLELQPKLDEVQIVFARGRSPAVLGLQELAASKSVPFYWDDENVSVGEGERSLTYPRDAIPAEVPWADLGRIPMALITGTNGKTTSSRMLARIAEHAGFRVGSTSTDGISIAGQVTERGDWTGPAAARLVLRDRTVQLAVLETARGGILRRGLAMEACDCALLTNIGDDHIGTYGIDDVAAMTRAKGVIARAVRPSGAVVLNAHDPNLVAFAQELKAEELKAELIYFGDLDRLDAYASTVLQGHFADGRRAVVVRGGRILDERGNARTDICAVNEIPITFQGTAHYNVENALGVTAAALALGLGVEAIAKGLTSFTQEDNPGRGQLVERRGVKVFLDFGHNPEGVRAVLKLVSALREPGGRLTIVTGSAGDRTDRELADIARTLHEAAPDQVYLRDLPGYLRGREPGVVPVLFQRAFLQLGMAAEQVLIAESEVDALTRIFESAAPADFVVVFVHLDHAEVAAFLSGL